MSKQLITIKARFLKSDDLIFDYKHRDLQKIEYVSKETSNGGMYNGVGVISNIHVSYGQDCDYADNFTPDDDVMILIDTDELKIIDSKNAGIR